MVRNAAALALVAFGLARDPGCGGGDSPLSGENGPCTRSRDCGGSLQCSDGVCTEPDAGVVRLDAGSDATIIFDAGADDDGG